MAECPNSPEASYHRFPHDKKRRDLWLQAIGTLSKKMSINQARICSEHFHYSAFRGLGRTDIFQMKSKRYLLPTALPTLKLGEKSSPSIAVDKLTRKRLVSEAVCSLPTISPVSEEMSIEVKEIESTVTSTVTSTTTTSSAYKSVGTQCISKRYKEALLKIQHLEKQLTRLRRKRAKKKIVLQYLRDVGHSETTIKHIMNPSLKFHRNYSNEDICTGTFLFMYQY